jgi:hypothetical protein
MMEEESEILTVLLYEIFFNKDCEAMINNYKKVSEEQRKVEVNIDYLLLMVSDTSGSGKYFHKIKVAKYKKILQTKFEFCGNL